jgi:hypothetical protein
MHEIKIQRTIPKNEKKQTENFTLNSLIYTVRKSISDSHKNLYNYYMYGDFYTEIVP